ncbi:MAG: alpha/beta hydrolase [Nocardioides sp.]
MDPTQFPTLDPELVGLVSMLPDMSHALDDLEAARAMVADMVPADQEFPGEELLEITDEVVSGSPDVRVRVYRPRDAASDQLPGVLDIHGGGFCLGSIDLEHGNAVALASRLGVVVVSVGYRLAPENPYPAGLDDCYLALEYLAARPDVDPSRIAVHGQSAGGGLAAAVALLARDRGGPALRFQALGIPELDDRLDTPSMRAFTDTPMWSRGQAERSWALYLGGQDADQYAAPARADDLAGLPPAYIVTCELDPLRDEGLTYAMRLLAAGVSVDLHSYPGTFHGTTIARGAAVVQRMEAELFGALERALA